ncbi:MAG: alanine:cation symporter family protein [Acidobacteriota bacterium]
MNDVLDFVLTLTNAVSGWIWGLPMVVLLFGTGLLLTLLTRFVQIRYFRQAVHLVLGTGGSSDEKAASKSAGDITPFQALMTALSSTVGNGNIAGVATAIAAGGPGAVVYMWLTAILGMATTYSEATLATLAARQQFGLPVWLTGALVAFLAGLVIIGGISRIGRVAEKLVPTMIVCYFLGAAVVILANLSQVPAAFELIFYSAWNPQAAFGGAVGIGVQQALRYGVARGLLSNEAGLGSSPIAHGAARTRYPVGQGSIAMMGVFIDTIVVCTLTALVIVITGAYRGSTLMVSGGLSGADLTVNAFNIGMPGPLAGWGGTIVVLSSLLFGFTTLLGWSYYGQICCEYLFGVVAVRPYRVVFIILVFFGSLLTGHYAPIITNIGDIFNAVMAFPNLIGLLVLAGIVARVTLSTYRARDMRAETATPIDLAGER